MLLQFELEMQWKAAASATGFPTGFVSAVTRSLWLRAVQLPL